MLVLSKKKSLLRMNIVILFKRKRIKIISEKKNHNSG